ncbi:hypothetical protein [Pseudomonas sp. PB106]|uniref:hypothetical protein n=1 Tax=Pseudomonas sp. PB106 TaxID=2494699 RepID=UPI00131A7DD0|nr:hypothetical protein [Pseudomonas sp. PB106]KAE9649118.1 hypothetical protein EJA71_03425 [Pseudomonas sp. PB106]
MLTPDITENNRSSEKPLAPENIVQIIETHRKVGTIAYFNRTPEPDPLNWTLIQQDLDSGKRELGAESGNASQIKHYLMQELTKSDRDLSALNYLIQKFDAYVHEHWSDFEDELCDQAARLVCQYNPEIEAFTRLLVSWPLLKSNQLLLERLITDFHANTSERSQRLSALGMLVGSTEHLRGILLTTLDTAKDSRGKTNQLTRFAELARKWSPDAPWAQLVAWIICDEPRPSSGLFYGHATKLQYVWEQLGYVGFRPWGPAANVSLSEFSPETESAWRRQLQCLIGDDLALKKAVTELLLWFGGTDYDHSIIFALAELWGDQLGAALAELHCHPASLVRLRAETLQGLISEVPNAGQLLLQAQSHRLGLAPPVGSALARTWIGDVQIEQLIERELEACARSFGNLVPATAGSGEENLAATLFANLASSFLNINTALQRLASQRKDNEYLQFTLQYRMVGKPEEGAPSLGATRFSTDVCLIFQAQEAGNASFTERGTLIQAKRMFGGDPVAKPETYSVKPTQLSDMVKQTLESYLLLIGPFESAPMPVIPAQLYLDLIKRGATTSRIKPALADQIGRGLASWLLYEVIGLWAGDPRTTVVKKALGGPGRGPFMLAELSAEKVLVRP